MLDSRDRAKKQSRLQHPHQTDGKAEAREGWAVCSAPKRWGPRDGSGDQGWDRDRAGGGMRLGLKMSVNLEQAGLVTELFAGRV